MFSSNTAKTNVKTIVLNFTNVDFIYLIFQFMKSTDKKSVLFKFIIFSFITKEKLFLLIKIQ